MCGRNSFFISPQWRGPPCIQHVLLARPPNDFCHEQAGGTLLELHAESLPIRQTLQSAFPLEIEDSCLRFPLVSDRTRRGDGRAPGYAGRELEAAMAIVVAYCLHNVVSGPPWTTACALAGYPTATSTPRGGEPVALQQPAAVGLVERVLQCLALLRG
jgi:hypothetical protein